MFALIQLESWTLLPSFLPCTLMAVGGIEVAGRTDGEHQKGDPGRDEVTGKRVQNGKDGKIGKSKICTQVWFLGKIGRADSISLSIIFKKWRFGFIFLPSLFRNSFAFFRSYRMLKELKQQCSHLYSLNHGHFYHLSCLAPNRGAWRQASLVFCSGPVNILGKLAL